MWSARQNALLPCLPILLSAISIENRIIIRPALLADAPVVVDFNVGLAEETEGLRLEPSTVRAGVAAVLQDLSKGIYFVAEFESQVIGQVMITYEWSDWRNGNIWWLQSVYVRQDCRRKGVFRMLFDYVHARARAQSGVCGIRLYMHSENERARRSYMSLGMKQTAYQVLELEISPTD